MTNDEIYRHIDHTQLKAASTIEDIYTLCDEAVKYKTASVCIPPSYVTAAKEKYGKELKICTVIGFPLGYNTTAVKAFEAKQAVINGADEIDMVVNIGWVKDNLFEEVTNEIKTVREAVGNKILKVIIETCYLNEMEKIMLCRCVNEAKADFIKTSTGFGTNGATPDDIKIFKENISKNVKMKAAGGVKTRSDLEMYISMGCERIGTSSAIKIISAENVGNCY